MQKFLNSLNQMEVVLKSSGATNILLLTGVHSYAQTGADKILKPLLHNYNVVRFQTTPNPDYSDIEKAVEAYKEHRADTIIAIGGGSTIDVAKATLILSPQTDQSEKIVKNNDVTKDPEALFIAIPTTAGSGAESTHFAVIYINKFKYSLSHPLALANYVVLDPVLTYSMPAHITASTGMDAIAQAIEAYWSIKSTEESCTFSRRALKKLIPNIEHAVHNPTPESRKAMLEGANLAGQAINIAQTTASHALSYGFTANYKIDHGEAVNLTLPFFMLFNSAVNENNCQDPRGSTFVKDRINEIAQLFGEPSIVKAIQKLKTLTKSIGLRNSLEIKETQQALKVLTESISINRLENNPRLVTSNDIYTALNSVVS